MSPARPRVVMFTPGHAEVGGAARRSRLLASAFREAGWDVRVITRAGTLRRFRVTRAPDVLVVEVPGFGQPTFGGLLYLVVAVVLGVAWATRARAFLAVQLVSPTTAASICSLIVRRPFICMATATGTLGELHYARKTRLARLRLWLLRRAAYVIAQNAVQAEELEEVARPGTVRTVPNPVELPLPPELTGSSEALFTGRFSEEKDLLGLLDAWAHLVCRRPDVRLTLVGNGGSYRSVEEALRARVESDSRLGATVTFTGWVPDVRPYLLTHDVFVLPSLTEGMSNSLLEAAAYGRVIVASDIPGNRAVLGDDYPLYFPPGDRDRLAATVEVAFEDEEVRLRARQILKERSASFGPDVVVRHLESLIEDAANRSRDQR